MKICYWSVAWGNYRYMLQTLVDSYKRVGMEHDFHAYTDGPFQGLSHPLDPGVELDSRQFFKFHYLQRVLKPLGYDIYVFIDADHYFVRKPETTPEQLLAGAPWHSFLESPLANNVQGARQDWWKCPVRQMDYFFRSQGVQARETRCSNGGHWVCHREFIDDAVRFALEFSSNCEKQGWVFQEEVAVAYLGHYMCADTSKHHLERHLNYWGTDWTAQFADRLPDGNPWTSTYYMSGRTELVNPAIVHAMRSKKALEAKGREILDAVPI